MELIIAASGVARVEKFKVGDSRWVVFFQVCANEEVVVRGSFVGDSRSVIGDLALLSDSDGSEGRGDKGFEHIQFKLINYKH